MHPLVLWAMVDPPPALNLIIRRQYLLKAKLGTSSSPTATISQCLQTLPVMNEFAKLKVVSSTLSLETALSVQTRLLAAMVARQRVRNFGLPQGCLSMDREMFLSQIRMTMRSASLPSMEISTP